MASKHAARKCWAPLHALQQCNGPPPPPPLPPPASYLSVGLLPAPLQDELRTMSREQWMQQYGGVVQSEEYFEKKAPGWNYDKNSW